MLLDPATGLAAALALTLSAFHVEISQFGRGHAAFLMLTVRSLGALVRAVDRQRARDWLWFSGLLAVTHYTHYLAVQVMVLEAAMAVILLAQIRFRGALPALVSFAGALVPLLPWLPVVRRLGSTQLGHGDLPAPLLHDLVTNVFVPQFLGPGAAATVGLGLIASAMASLRRRCDLALGLGLWILLPPVLLWVAQPAHFIAGRHLAFALPIVMLLLGHGAVALARATRWALRGLGVAPGRLVRVTGALAALVAMLAWGAPAAGALRRYYEGRQGMDWRDVASVLERVVPAGEPVAATDGALYPLRHYWSLRVTDLAAAGFPGPPRPRDGARWIVMHGGWDRPAALAPWLDTHAVKVGEVPASWSVPGLAIYRLRVTARAAAETSRR